jgi:hypothetical protein
MTKSKAIELIKQQLEQTGKVDANAVAQATGYHPDYIRRLTKRIKAKQYAEGETPEAITPKVEVEKVETVPAVPVEFPEVEGKAEEIVGEVAELGEWTEEHVYSLISMVDSLFPEDCRHTEEQNRALSKAWVKPFNRLLQKYADQNADLYIAIVVTVLWLVPPISKIVSKRVKKPKPKEEELAKLGTTEIKVPAKMESGKFGEQSFQPT